MGIAQHKPTAPVPLDVQPTVAVSKNYETTIVDSKQTPIVSLRAYLDGSIWTTEAYYAQVINKHTGLSTVDVTIPNSYQSYEKIIGIELRVQSPLNNSFDQESGLTTVTGTAVIPSVIVPSKGDVFIAAAGYNRKAAFGITSVERLQFNTESAYQIEYELLFDISTEVDRYNDLEEKTQRTYYYHKERYIQGLDAKVIESDHKNLLVIQGAFSKLVSYYFKHFFNDRFSTLVLPGQIYEIYDHRLVEFILMLVDSPDCFEITKTRLLNVDNDRYISQESIYDAVMQRDASLLSRVHRYMGVASTSSFSYEPMTHSIRYSGLDYIVYPLYPDESIDLPSTVAVKPRFLHPKEGTAPGLGNLGRLQNQYVCNNLSVPFVPDISLLSTYLFSDDFYEGKSVSTLLEIVLSDYINHRAIQYKELSALIENYHKWNRMEQFYYLPFIIMLVRFVTRK